MPKFKSLRWQKATYSPLQRHLEISSVACQLLLYLFWDNLLGKNFSQKKHRLARWLVRKLLELGPTFIKIGQSLSTRADLIPLEYIEELTQLQDRVPPFSSQEAIALIESELGHSVSELFLEFEAEPLASASLGQVHRATLLTGEKVVVKVQRSGLEKLFNLDFECLHQLVRIASRYMPQLRKYELESIYQEFFQLLYQEIDYIHEGKNADRFRENFSQYSRVLVPKVYWHYTTKKILTLEYLPGIKINDRQALIERGIDTDEIIQIGICSYLKQLLEDGFFQSDPHPGNMAVSERGEIIFYDFGTMAEVKSLAKDEMIKTFFAVLKKDGEQVLNSLIYMGLIEPRGDLIPVKRLITFLLDKFREKPIDIRAFEEISSEVYLMFEQQPFRLPAQMTFIIKSLTTLDGIARALDPQYNLIAASQPFVKSITRSQPQGSLIRIIAKQTLELIKNSWQQPSKTERILKQLEAKIEQGELKVQVRSLESERLLRLIYLALKALIYSCITGCGVIGAILLLHGAYTNWAIAAFCIASFSAIMLLRSLIELKIRERL
jgi:predicted unusual protein kinase regulating ubiquinone biosynthesis (AarF/ABC1/UbiB family)